MAGLSAYIQSDWAWIVLFVMAIFVGMSKTGVQGLAILTVPMLAMTFGAKPSTGLMLPVLCFADVIGVSYYRRQAEWKYIIRLLPMAIAGFFLALWVDNMIPASEFKHLMGACLALVLAVMLWSQWNIPAIHSYAEVGFRWNQCLVFPVRELLETSLSGISLA